MEAASTRQGTRRRQDDHVSLEKPHVGYIDALIIGSATPKLVNMLDRFWNSAHAYAVAQIVAGDRSP